MSQPSERVNPQSQSFNSYHTNAPGSFKPSFKSIFNLTDTLLVKTYNDEKLRSSEAEIENLSTQGDQVMIEFFPNLKSKWVSLILFILGLYASFTQKASIIASKKSPKEEKPKKENPIEVPLTLENSYPINPNKRF